MLFFYLSYDLFLPSCCTNSVYLLFVLHNKSTSSFINFTSTKSSIGALRNAPATSAVATSHLSIASVNSVSTSPSFDTVGDAASSFGMYNSHSLSSVTKKINPFSPSSNSVSLSINYINDNNEKKSYNGVYNDVLCRIINSNQKLNMLLKQHHPEQFDSFLKEHQLHPALFFFRENQI